MGQRQINYAVRLFRRAVAHSQVFAPERVGVQGAAQNILGVGMFGYCHYAGGAFVQPVHRVEIGWDAAAIVISQQKTAQRIVPMAQSGMDGNTGALLRIRRSSSSYKKIQRARRWNDLAAAHTVAEPDAQHLSGANGGAGSHTQSVQGNAVV